MRKDCVNNVDGRILESNEYQNLIDDKAQRIKENPNYYRLR